MSERCFIFHFAPLPLDISWSLEPTFCTKVAVKQQQHFFGGYTMIDNIKSEIQRLRDDIGVKFQRWYDETKQLTSYIGTKEEMTWVPRFQCNRSNVQEINWHSFYWYIIATVAEPFLCRQLPAIECFAESNTFFYCQTRNASPGSIWIMSWWAANSEVIR